MPVLRFMAKNLWFQLPSVERWTNGDNIYMELAEGLLVEGLRGNPDVIEEDKLPPERARKFIEAQNSTVEHPLPDFPALPVVLLGRGVSSKGFRNRYPKGEYLVVAVNPGSFPVSRTGGKRESDPTDGMHGDSHADIDIVCTLDALYHDECSQFLRTYHGPVMGPESCKPNYTGPGTYHSVDYLCRRGRAVGLSFEFALCSLFGAGAKDIILCGVDCEGNSKDVRPGVMGIVTNVRANGARIWVDSETRFKELGKVWRN